MQDYSYLGSGQIYARVFGAAAALIAIGNCSSLNLSPQVESKELKDFTTPGGGLQNEVSRNTGVELSYTFHDFSAANFARALRGDATSIAGGTETDEAAVAYKDGFLALAKIPSAVTEVTDSAGVVTYVEGTDYELRSGGLFVLAAGAIPDAIAGAANILVTYTFATQEKVQAMVNPATQYELIFAGMNEARSGKVTRINCFKVSHGVMQQLAALGEDYGAGEVTGKLLKDGSKTGTGISQYFTVEMES